MTIEEKYLELLKKNLGIEKIIDTCSPTLKTGEGKRRNEFAEWHVAWLAECIIMRNLIYADRFQRNKLN